MIKREISPPRLADKFFEWYCQRASIEDLHGDITEIFYQEAETLGSYQAKVNYWRRVFSLTSSYALKKRKQRAAYHPYSYNSMNIAMLKNYFQIASRNLVKHKFFTIINIIGLALGMSFSLLLIAMLSFVWRYDNFHVNKDFIYRVISTVDENKNTRELATAPRQLSDKLKELSGIKKVTRISNKLSGEVAFGERKIELEGFYVDANFLDVFSFQLTNGNTASVLKKSNSLLITETGAKKLFGDVDPIGKIVTANEHDFEITGVLKDLPRNSHIQLEIVANYDTYANSNPVSLVQHTEDLRGSYLYYQLIPGTDPTTVEDYLKKIPAATYTNNPELIINFEHQQLLNIATGADLRYQIGPAWDYPSLAIFFSLTLMILLPACFNYANIAISRALKRTKEIGMRKVLGGQRNQIFTQFILETVITTLVALILAFHIFMIVRAEFLSMLADKNAMELNTDPLTLFMFFVFALIVGSLTGILPAAYLSKLNPIQALKSKTTQGRFSVTRLRKALLIGQFALSLGFIMSVIIVINQYRHTVNYDLGFQRENILDVELQGTDPQQLMNEFNKLPAVQNISLSSGIAGIGTGSSWLKLTERNDSIESYEMFVDHQYIANLDLELIAGQNFTNEASTNEKIIIINQEFLKSLNINNPVDAIGKIFTTSAGTEVRVGGVVKNFHYAGLRERIKPFCFRYDASKFNYANISMLSTSMFESLSDMESSWKKLSPEIKFSAKFLDDELEETYDFYFTMVKICGFLGLLAITISCLGLLGMVVFTVENRTKEVGVRKVMGASAGQITVLLSGDFLKLMIFSAFIAIPLTYLFFDVLYLPTQHYHAPIGFIDVAGSLLLMLMLGLVTVLSQTLKASRSNPVDTLRYE